MEFFVLRKPCKSTEWFNISFHNSEIIFNGAFMKKYLCTSLKPEHIKIFSLILMAASGMFLLIEKMKNKS